MGGSMRRPNKRRSEQHASPYRENNEEKRLLASACGRAYIRSSTMRIISKKLEYTYNSMQYDPSSILAVDPR
ncbi:hypothetical protein HID58_016382 [Brassica napus]|uniref:Uncharacterized protein n=1 Tax=Brassica napus TaxID=3708 RepID=A0ABQ8DQ67_BRANA|nr:hypothetical protein HID58_016382 [Brassica napus]